MNQGRLPPLTIRWPWESFYSGSTRLKNLVRTAAEDKIVRVTIGPREFWVVSDVDSVRHVLQENYKNYGKGRLHQEMQDFMGNGLFTAEWGGHWLRQRRLAQPAFHLKALAGLADAMAAQLTSMVEGWAPLAAAGTAFNATPEMARLALAVVGRTLFGVDILNEARQLGHDFTMALENVDGRILNPLRIPRWIPTWGNIQYKRAHQRVDTYIREMLRSRIAAGDAAPKDDLLALLLAARDADTGEGMNEQQLIDEAITILVAGHETTATVLAWTWLVLSQHPDVAARLQAEIDEVLQGRAPTWADLPKLSYSAKVFQEVGRMYPPNWVIVRESVEDDELCGYRVPAGTVITLCSYAVHHNPDYWPDPERFDPERFAPEAVAARDRFSYLLFGGGPRVCIGSQFALMEAQIMMAVILQRYEVEVDPTHRVEPRLMVLLRPGGGPFVRLRPRRARVAASSAA